MAVPKIAVIGAGPSGITAAKNVLEAGLGEGLTVFEKSNHIGGNWVYRDAEGHSSVYETTHIISSRYYSAYEDFPFPEGTPAYPHHSHLYQYFNDYADHFGVRAKIQFQTEILNANYDPTLQKWVLKIKNQANEVRVEAFDFLLVANGHHWNPRYPSYDGKFTGKWLHSHEFKHNRPFKDQRVLVIGAGNSGADVAVECSRVTKHTSISVRRSQWFLPKFMFGMPGDVMYEKTLKLPNFLRQTLLQKSIEVLVGKNAKYGFANPKHKILEGHPTANSELLYFTGHGKITPRVGVQRLEGETVHFVDGTKADFDVIICATGYKITFPFFDKNLVNWEDSHHVPLWRKMFPDGEKLPKLYFIGLFQPLGCIWPMADYQARLACQEILGKYQRPKNLKQAIESERKNPHFNFVASPRHSTQVDYGTFRNELIAELKKAGIAPRADLHAAVTREAAKAKLAA